MDNNELTDWFGTLALTWKSQVFFVALTLLVSFYLGLPLIYTAVLSLLVWSIIVWPPAKLAAGIALALLILAPGAYYFHQPEDAKKLMAAALLVLVGAVGLVASELRRNDS